MAQVAFVLALVVAFEHVGFLVLEMFLWTKPIGLRIFKTTPEVAASSATLAANQGLYNGFLAAGLLCGLVIAEPAAFVLKAFVLSCVVVAGIFGAVTVSPRILAVQALPGALALAALLLA
jgi:putative membrane protein